MTTDGKARAWLRKGDLWVLAAVLAAAWLLQAGLTFWGGRHALKGEVRLDGEIALRLDLRESGDFTLPQHPAVVFRVRDGAAAFIRSDCPDQVCVRAGFLDAPGQTAVCLPNRVSLTVTGTESLDAVAE